MSDTVTKQIQSLIDRETLGLNSKDADLFVDFIHDLSFAELAPQYDVNCFGGLNPPA